MTDTALEFQEEDTQKGRFLTFMLGNESYGIEIMHVTEIIGIQPVTEVPEVPEYIRGIINLRGKIIPVMDVRLRFKKAFMPYNDRTCIIVVDINHVSIGLIVDKVVEVIAIADSEIVSPPDVQKSSNKYIKGIGKVGKEVKMLLDCEQMISEQDMNEMINLK